MINLPDLTRSKLHVAAAEILGCDEPTTREGRKRAAHLAIVMLGGVDAVTALMALTVAECLHFQLDPNAGPQRIKVADVVAAFNIDGGFEIGTLEAALALRLLGCTRVGKHWQTEAGYADDFTPAQEDVFESVF